MPNTASSPAAATQAQTQASTIAHTHAEGRGRIYASIADTIGATPLVRLNRLPKAARRQGEILAEARILQSASAASRTASASR